MNFFCKHLPALVTGLAMTLLPAISQAEYPDRPIKLVVPYTPGGPASLLARFLGLKLQQALGQPVIIENKPGAGLSVGTQFVANSTPDGYTLLVAASSMLVPTSPGGRTPADNLKDFTAITLIGGLPLMLVSSAQFQVTTVPELISYARSHPGQINYGTSGNGSLTHMAAALFAQLAGVDMVHVPYRGISEALVDLSAGRVHIAFAGIPTTLPMISGGKMRAMAVTSTLRAAAAPQLPTIAEALPGYQLIPWYGIVAPVGTPTAIISRLHRELTIIMQTSEVREKWKEWGADPTYSKSPEDFSALMQTEVAKWDAFSKPSGIKLQ